MPLQLVGDYDNSGIVDQSDYNVWEIVVRLDVSDLRADGNKNGEIDLGRLYHLADCQRQCRRRWR